MKPRDPAAADESLAPSIITGNVLVGAAAIVAVVLRVVARRMKRNALEADDVAVFIALPLALAIVVANLIACAYGLGHHIQFVPMDHLQIEVKALLGAQMIWGAAIAAVKASILLLYIRVLGSVRWMRVLSYIVGAFSACLGLVIIMTMAFACTPFEYNWRQIRPGGHCINRILFLEIITGFNVATDIFILLMPVPVVWKLHVPRAEKLEVASVFFLGSLTCAVSIVRWAAVFDLDFADATWNMTSATVWSAAEACLGIVASCLLTMKPLLQAIVSRRSSLATSNEPKEGGNPAAIIQLRRFSKHDVESYQHMSSNG